MNDDLTKVLVVRVYEHENRTKNIYDDVREKIKQVESNEQNYYLTYKRLSVCRKAILPSLITINKKKPSISFSINIQ